MRVVNNSTYHEVRDAISHDWLVWIQKHNATPVIIPNIYNNKLLEDPEPYDLLILSNGNDVINSDSQSDYSELRNAIETSLVNHAIDNEIPVFGVCRGMQFLNTYFNGSLTLDIKKEGAINHVAKYHKITLSENIEKNYGCSELITNSYHNQGIFLENLSSELITLAVCQDDNIVEAFRHKSYPIIGVQWHPERKNPITEFDNWLLNSLFKETSPGID